MGRYNTKRYKGRYEMEVKEHGSSGYRAGCRCFVCRLAHKDDAALYRARKRGEVPAPKVPAVIPDGAGVQESLTLSEIADLDLDTMEGASLANMAVTAARAVDAIERSGRWHLMPAAVRSLTQLMDKLRALDIPETSAPFDDDDEDTRPLGWRPDLGSPEYRDWRHEQEAARDHLPYTYYFHSDDGALVQTYDKAEAEAKNAADKAAGNIWRAAHDDMIDLSKTPKLGD